MSYLVYIVQKIYIFVDSQYRLIDFVGAFFYVFFRPIRSEIKHTSVFQTFTFSFDQGRLVLV